MDTDQQAGNDRRQPQFDDQHTVERGVGEHDDGAQRCLDQPQPHDIQPAETVCALAGAAPAMRPEEGIAHGFTPSEKRYSAAASPRSPKAATIMPVTYNPTPAAE